MTQQQSEANHPVNLILKPRRVALVLEAFLLNQCSHLRHVIQYGTLHNPIMPPELSLTNEELLEMMEALHRQLLLLNREQRSAPCSPGGTE